MPNFGESFLSRILDDGSTFAIREFSVERSDFPTQTEREVFDFITEYASTNRNKAPDYRTVVERFPDFYYRENVTDSYRYMANELKSYRAKREVAQLINEDVEEIINGKDGNSAIEDLLSRLESIKLRTSVREKVGTNLKLDGDKIIAEYNLRKRGESYRTWRSFLPIIPEYISANVYVIYGKSGRGKSAVTLMEAIHLAMQGAKVLIWAMEMSTYELFVRIFTYYSRLVGNIATAEIQGVNMDVGFNSSDLRNGKLSEEFEEKFFEFIGEINELLDGNIIVRGIDDEDFHDRSLRALESDIIQTEADVVVVDAFYHLDYEKNTSRTTGGDAANTSKKLRRLAGSSDTVIFAITQAEETEEEKNESGTREVKLPQRKDVKKTKALLEDATMLIAVDTNYLDGRGLVGINKGRNGGEGEEQEIIYLPQYGIIEPLSVDEAELQALISEF